MRAYYLIVIAAGLLAVGDAVRATNARHLPSAGEAGVQTVARIVPPSAPMSAKAS